ncbi:hypothetical protein PPROV_000095600 [Pycnococcus provasolii]|uniref:Uncharacterized protein n=1 Tax=Pycnococcus provasolii TaxID=41880 RepID=A0A830H9S8_9CHLO|nr:hypothetical protein PPROV_000095600 [Pycnococcus provasolii]
MVATRFISSSSRYSSADAAAAAAWLPQQQRKKVARRRNYAFVQNNKGPLRAQKQAHLRFLTQQQASSASSANADAAPSAYSSSFTMNETRVVANIAGQEVTQKLERWMQIAEVVFAISVVRYAIEIAVDVRLILSAPGSILTLKSVLSMLWEHSSIVSPLAITGLIAQARLGLFARQQLVPALICDATAMHFFRKQQDHETPTKTEETEVEEPTTIAVSLRVLPGDNEDELVPNEELRSRARALVPDNKAWSELVEELFPFLSPLANLFQRLAWVVLTIELPQLVSAIKVLVATGVTGAV